MPRIAAAVREILIAIGEDPDREGIVDTPARVAKMYAETCAGLHERPEDHLLVTFEADHDEMVLVRDIPIYSMCEHHLVPFFGKAHIAYIPNEEGQITGLSKMARLADWFANDLTLGTAANEGGSGKWSFHSLSFRDDAEAYGHSTQGNWAGIVSVVRAAMATYAK